MANFRSYIITFSDPVDMSLDFSAGMATKVQAKYFPGSMMDLNNGLYNVMWDPYHDDRNQGYNSFLMSQTMDGYLGYPKEQMRQTILKQESIFRHQVYFILLIVSSLKIPYTFDIV